MFLSENSTDPTDGFSGQAPLFPLPDTALFPNVLLPLHIFEPRYKCMVEDVLKSDGFLALALLKDAHDENYGTKTCAIHDTVCLSKVVADDRLDDGRYYLLLQGLCRAKLVTEVPNDLPYRMGILDLISDEYSAQPVIDRDHRKQELVSHFSSLFPQLGVDQKLLLALDTDVALGELCDVIAHAMRLDSSVARSLLEQSDVDERSELLLQLLKLQCRDHPQSPGFPPSFSLN
ncbi:MAG: LON peptidase substrate-binding domain-containing protein [Planctomycetota bacterium]|jgi:Lon protease-like protein